MNALTTEPSPLLSRLPSELRIAIYELLLAFEHPIKLRQTVAGSDKTNVLRTNKQTYNEVLAVLYECNTISVTRNDFCKNTAYGLKTPVDGRHIRHLRMTTFGESIACSFLQNSCDVCSDHGRGLLTALREMPRLQTVTIDHSSQLSTFRRFQAVSLDWTAGRGLDCIGVGRYRISRQDSGGPELTFEHRALAAIWPRLDILTRTFPSEQEEDEELVSLRAIDPDIPDKLWLLHCARKYGLLHELSCRAIEEIWFSDDVLEDMSIAQRSVTLDHFTSEVLEYLPGQTAAQARVQLRRMRL
ncbi:hypothetical protein LTR62_000865 [Meristemomyces frigidus]|uniref:F-box domain-containing protein n=1 Tax=Meristemomyces frigidus TaxID=1508187 RepID=A0AAN7TM80_9PEZI|nr:hypothetical protein LTR62_000865 [Meristemomyces frigidus]